MCYMFEISRISSLFHSSVNIQRAHPIRLIRQRSDLQHLFGGPGHPIDIALLAQNRLAPLAHVVAEAAKSCSLHRWNRTGKFLLETMRIAFPSRMEDSQRFEKGNEMSSVICICPMSWEIPIWCQNRTKAAACTIHDQWAPVGINESHSSWHLMAINNTPEVSPPEIQVSARRMLKRELHRWHHSLPPLQSANCGPPHLGSRRCMLMQFTARRMGQIKLLGCKCHVCKCVVPKEFRSWNGPGRLSMSIPSWEALPLSGSMSVPPQSSWCLPIFARDISTWPRSVSSKHQTLNSCASQLQASRISRITSQSIFFPG